MVEDNEIIIFFTAEMNRLTQTKKLRLLKAELFRKAKLCIQYSI